MSKIICPTCQLRQLALFPCDDGKHRCWYCKAVPKPSAVLTTEPSAVQSSAPSEHERLLQARVAIRNRLARLESLSGWDKSPWNCGKHAGLSEALAVLMEGGL